MNQADLTTALNQIASSVVSCVYEIDTEETDDVDFDEVNFYFDDEVVYWDEDCTQGIGWRWVDDEKSAVEFCDQACDQLQAGDVDNISATFGCPTEIAPQ